MKKLRPILFLLSVLILFVGCWETKKKSSQPSDSQEAAELEVVHPDKHAGTAQKLSDKQSSPLLFDGPASTPYVLSTVQELAQDKLIEFDLNKDGKQEHILLGRDHPNGVRVLATYNSLGQNLINEIDEDVFFDSYGELKAPHAIQVSVADLDGDGKYELVVSLGKKGLRIDSFFFGFDVKQGFYYLNSVSATEPVTLSAAHTLEVLQNGVRVEYQLKNKQLVQLH